MMSITSFSDNLRNTKRANILQSGFEKDDLLPIDPNISYYGLNLAIGWPLPASILQAYEDLRNSLANALNPLSSGIYLYPYEQTHVTIATLVNFKNYRLPKTDDCAAIDVFSSSLVYIFNSIFKIIKPRPFEITINAPELDKKAAFFPIIDHTATIDKIRMSLGIVLDLQIKMIPNNYLLNRFEREMLMNLKQKTTIDKVFRKQILIPNIIHSTILRFSSRHNDNNNDLIYDAFYDTAEHFIPCSCSITNLLLTSETMPYMEDGNILHSFPLPFCRENND